MNLLGVDIGTTGVKACIFNEEGQCLAQAYREYILAGNCFELNADGVFDCFVQAVRQISSYGAVAIAFSVSGDEVVPVDREGNCLYNMIMSMDSRGTEGMEYFLRHFSAEQLYMRTGLPAHVKYGANRILWFKNRRPDIFDATWRFLTWEDFMLLRLGVKDLAVSVSTAARLMLFNIHSMCWDADILSCAGIDKVLLSSTVPSGTPVGKISREAASLLGFKEPLMAVAGGFDQACAAMGAGVIKPGDACVNTGTMESLSVYTESFNDTDVLLQGSYPCNMHTIAGGYLIGATNVGGGLLVKWLRDYFYSEETANNKASKSNVYESMFTGLKKGPSELILLPHFAGSGPPYKDKNSIGAVLGLTPQTDKKVLLKAVLEGITFELKQNIDIIRGNNIPIKKLIAIGGGSNSAYWLQLKADITGITVVKPEISEAGCFAAAILAGVGAGVYSGASVIHQFIKVERVFKPGEIGKAYEPYYDLYKRVYPAIAEILHGLKECNTNTIK